MMMRLIDGDALADSLRESKNKLKEILDDERCEMEYRICEGQMITFIEAILRVNETPTIDAVPVVRCKDCKYRGNSFACPMCHDESIYDDDDGYDDYTYDRTDDDGFCNNGERWDEDAVD